MKEKESVAPRIAVYLGLSKALPSDAGNAIEQPVNPDIPSTANAAAIEKLRSNGLTVRLMLHKPMMLDITLPAGSNKKMADIKNELTAIAKNIVWLNLSGNNFTDKDLDFLHQLTNIEKLRLDKNPVSDNISDQLVALQHLEALNLNETNISSPGLAKLEKNPSIKRIYSFKTVIK